MKKPIYILLCLVMFTFIFLVARNGAVKAALGHERTIPILMYHHVVDEGVKTNKISVTTERFIEDMKYLKEKGYTAITFKELIDYREGKRKFPSKLILITFDDGLEDNYRNAYPVLKSANMKATIFVIGSRMGVENYNNDPRYSYFSWGQAKEMYGSGLIEIQPHTYDLHYYKESFNHGHGVLPMKNESKKDHYNRFLEDTNKVIRQIKDNVGTDCYIYAYPYGDYVSTNEEVLKDLGFQITLTTRSKHADISRGLYGLKRINVPSHKKLNQLGI